MESVTESMLAVAVRTCALALTSVTAVMCRKTLDRIYGRMGPSPTSPSSRTSHGRRLPGASPRWTPPAAFYGNLWAYRG